MADGELLDSEYVLKGDIILVPPEWVIRDRSNDNALYGGTLAGDGPTIVGDAETEIGRFKGQCFYRYGPGDFEPQFALPICISPANGADTIPAGAQIAEFSPNAMFLVVSAGWRLMGATENYRYDAYIQAVLPDNRSTEQVLTFRFTQSGGNNPVGKVLKVQTAPIVAPPASSIVRAEL